MAKEFFQKSNVQYTEHDVANDDAAREEMIKKSHQMGVPVIDVGGEIFVGFNRTELERALGLK
jgi:glutaredoxin